MKASFLEIGWAITQDKEKAYAFHEDYSNSSEERVTADVEDIRQQISGSDRARLDEWAEHVASQRTRQLVPQDDVRKLKTREGLRSYSPIQIDECVGTHVRITPIFYRSISSGRSTFVILEEAAYECRDRFCLLARRLEELYGMTDFRQKHGWMASETDQSQADREDSSDSDPERYGAAGDETRNNRYIHAADICKENKSMPDISTLEQHSITLEQAVHITGLSKKTLAKRLGIGDRTSLAHALDALAQFDLSLESAIHGEWFKGYLSMFRCIIRGEQFFRSLKQGDVSEILEDIQHEQQKLDRQLNRFSTWRRQQREEESR
ncbi:hypothetical protein GF351_01110 [Candidatus Woesearchaeota archaeon]|nr:hypothetical protein [Candidatus Woesearchaeota archaeon]